MAVGGSDPTPGPMGVTERKAFMRRVLVTAMFFALLMGLMALPAVAGGPHGKATGTVEWTARTHLDPGLWQYGFVASFSVHDEAPGMNGDRGFWTLTRAEGSYTIDIDCVNVDGNEAWFAGTVTEGYGMWDQRPGEVQLVWVKDLDTPGRNEDVAAPGSGGDLLGVTRPPLFDGDLVAACEAVDNGSWTGTGVVSGGNLKVHSPGG